MALDYETRETLKPHFRLAGGEGKTWIYCRRCRASWSFPTGKPFGAGATLTLLDHAATHDQDQGDNGRRAS